MVQIPPNNPDEDASSPRSQALVVDGLWRRIKDHKIIQWGLAYVGAALAIAHGQELMAESFGWSHFVGRTVMALLIVGRPIALTLAWYHGHKGLRRVSQGELLIASLLLVIGAGLLIVFVRAPDDTRGAAEARNGGELVPQSLPTTKSSSVDATPRENAAAPQAQTRLRIAILPFENLSPDPANAFFAEGIHEEVISAIANTSPDLDVISRTTMMSYKDKPVTVEQVAKDLGCSHVLEGSVRREGNEVRLTLQLIDAKADRHVWSQNCDRKLVSTMSLQTEVAGEVASQLSVKLAQGARIAPTSDPAAYDLYLKARLARENLNGPSTLEAWQADRALFTQAIERDPKFVLAYVGRIEVDLWLFAIYFDTSADPLDEMRSDLAIIRGLAPSGGHET